MPHDQNRDGVRASTARRLIILKAEMERIADAIREISTRIALTQGRVRQSMVTKMPAGEGEVLPDSSMTRIGRDGSAFQKEALDEP